MRGNFLVGLSLLTLAACGADADLLATDGGWPGSGDSGSAAAPDGGAPTNTADGGVTTTSPDGGVTVGGLSGCAGTRTTAPPASDPRIDIVWILDGSGSMLDENKRIGANLTAFANSITQANLDVTITMITTSPAIPVVCPVIDPNPLIGTPLENDPRYHFIEAEVDSFNLLQIAVDEYDRYAQFLRPGSSVQYVFVTDDESNFRMLGSADERANAFRTEMTAKLGRSFTAHTIASEGPEACNDPNCMPDTNSGICFFVMLGCGAQNPGDTYYKLAADTRGVSASICQSDWTGIFQQLEAGVIASAPLPCDYGIPPPPAGDSLDPKRVNVAYTAPGASELIYPKAASSSDCANELGWYYDNESAPTKVLLCPAACAQAAAGGSMNIAFGCNTVVLR